MKSELYRKIKNWKIPLRGRYVELPKSVKDTRLAKRNYEIMVAKEAMCNPKAFLNLYWTKTRKKIEPLKTNTH